MPWLRRLASLHRNLRGRPRVERDLDDELRAYLDQLTDEKRAAGMGVAEAQRDMPGKAGLDPPTLTHP